MCARNGKDIKATNSVENGNDRGISMEGLVENLLPRCRKQRIVCSSIVMFAEENSFATDFFSIYLLLWMIYMSEINGLGNVPSSDWCCSIHNRAEGILEVGADTRVLAVRGVARMSRLPSR